MLAVYAWREQIMHEADVMPTTTMATTLHILQLGRPGETGVAITSRSF